MSGAKINTRGGQPIKVLLLAFFLLTIVASGDAQRSNGRSDDSPGAAQQAESEEDEDYIKPSRPTVANPAEIQTPGVLQLEYGYDSNFRASEFRLQQSAPLGIRFAVSSRFLLEAQIDTVFSQRREAGGEIETGVGDTRLGFQIVALKETERRPALAFAYAVKLPTASEEKMLGTGRYDHRLTALFSKKLGENTDLDVSLAYINAGREDNSRRADGALAAFAVSHEFKNKFGFEAELSGMSLDDVQPKGVYALGALTYKVSKRLRFDTGMRFGLSGEAPRAGFFAGFTVGVGKLFRK